MSANVFALMFTNQLYLSTFVFTPVFSMWLYCQHLFFSCDHMVPLMSIFVFRLMFKIRMYCQHLCLLLWSDSKCMVYICVYAFEHIVTLLLAFVFTLIITYKLCCLHLRLRLWSHIDCIVSIWFTLMITY